ncbi:NAD(P)-binding protein [Ceraceosorus guamensis]|uniref:NAD(P)-binding protein n=1 Tax=Ceraceosorus guamensis TaxID=1522189 RepID=A0A316W508_9BASI|nr:NAD(P)-binding protein [Ceraceosorus guamensis]PWN44990.1 NAD(P)-binding protein [Ceraceosorus guamensis]
MPAAPKTSQKLAGKKYVLLGGTSGIGFAVASALIEEGASVVVSSSGSARVEEAVRKLSDAEQQFNADPSRASGHALDLFGPEVESRLNAFFAKVGPIDGLIHSAGDSLDPLPLEEVTYQAIVERSSVRYFSVILAIKAALPHLKPHSSIVFTSGTNADQPIPGLGIMSGLAAGLYGLARGLALDLSPRRIRVNAVVPGATLTELFERLPAEVKNYLLEEASKQPTWRVGHPEDVAQTYLYLLKDDNITGQTIKSDSGKAIGPRPGA